MDSSSSIEMAVCPQSSSLSALLLLLLNVTSGGSWEAVVVILQCSSQTIQTAAGRAGRS